MAAPTHVQSASTESGTTTADVATGSNVTSGNFLIMFQAGFAETAGPNAPVKQAGTATIGSVTDAGPGWQHVTSDVSGRAWKCQVTGTGSLTMRFTAGTGGGNCSGTVTEVAPAAGGTLDVDGTLNSGNTASYSGTLVNTPTLTSVPANDFVWAAATVGTATLSSQSVNAGASTPNTGWTMGTHQDSTTNSPIEAGYNQGGTASNYTCQFTETGAQNTWNAVQFTIAIKETGAAAALVATLEMPMQNTRGLVVLTAVHFASRW